MSDFLANLARLDAEASAGPWFVRQLNDGAMMGAVAVSTTQSGERPDTWTKEWVAEEMVAGCLIQEPPYVLPADGRWQANADLIAAMRNGLPELLRLAALGRAAETLRTVS